MSVTLKVQSYVDRSGLITLTEVERITNAPRPMLERLLEEEIVQPVERQETEPLFLADDVRVIERCLRLHEDLGVNWPGVAIIEHLLEQLSDLRTKHGDEDSGPVVDVSL